MTLRAIGGLVVLNGLVAVCGLALLYALRGLRTWTDVVRLAGLGYLLGLGALGILWTELLVVRVPFGGWTILSSVAAIAAGAVLVGSRRGMPRPHGWMLPGTVAGTLTGAAGIAAIGLYLEALFGAARLQSLQNFDAWAFWVPKAKAIYFFGGLDEQVFTTAAGPSYPPLLPVLDAAAFHAMGGADVVTLHLQFWFVAVALVAALAGSLAPHVPAWLLVPSLLLVMVVPRFSAGLLAPLADVLVDTFFVLAALSTALWLRDGRGWRLAATAVLLGAAVSTKREGLLLAALVVFSALVGGLLRGRSVSGVIKVFGFVMAVAIPWQLWYRSRELASDAPDGVVGGGSFDRGVDALRLSLEVLFDDGLWSVVPTVFAIALVVALFRGDRRLAGFTGALAALVVLGGAWITFAFAEMPITADEAVNPIVRYTGAAVLLASAFTPLLLASVWRASREHAR